MPFSQTNTRRHAIQIVTLSLYRFDTPWNKAWAFVMMGLARFELYRTPHLKFWKLLGSGTGEGFTPIPNWGVYAILCVWDDRVLGRRAYDRHPLFARYKRHSAQAATLFLEAFSTRGEWSGHRPFSIRTQEDDGPVAILTRATVRWSKIVNFWKHAPAISERIGANPDVLFKIGLGEVPLRQQLTFSIWQNVNDMAQFAHSNGAHKAAIECVRSGRWFKEELYARFNITEIEGHWPAFQKQPNQEQSND